MKNKKILLLRTGFHKEFAYKTLLREGYELIILDKAASSNLAYADQAYLTNSIWDADTMFEEAKKIYLENACDGIVTFLDSCTLLMGKLSDYFKLNYYSEGTAKILSNKIKMREHLENKKLSHIKYAMISELGQLEQASKITGFPCVLKPSDRSGSKGVIVCHNKAQLKEAYLEASKYSKNSQLLLEEYIKGKEHCAEILMVNEVPYILCISEKIVTDEHYCIELVDITPAPLSDEIYADVQEYLFEVAKCTQVKNGMLHIEFKILSEKCFEVIEVNPRCAGGNLIESYTRLTGYNGYSAIYQLATGDYENLTLPSECLTNSTSDYYMLFNSFLHKGGAGRIVSISGVDNIKKMLKYDCDKVLFYYDVGDCIETSSNNESAFGTIYIKDQDYKQLVARNCAIEEAIQVRVK